jgi:hypothetical protein
MRSVGVAEATGMGRFANIDAVVVMSRDTMRIEVNILLDFGF